MDTRPLNQTKQIHLWKICKINTLWIMPKYGMQKEELDPSSDRKLRTFIMHQTDLKERMALK
jgi:hypothetical protein